MQIRIKTKYLDEQARVEFVRYSADNTIGIKLWATGSFPEQLATATVCLQEYRKKPSDYHIFIKDYSENEGMYQTLIDAGIVEADGECHVITFPGTAVYDAKLTQKALDEIKAQGI